MKYTEALIRDIGRFGGSAGALATAFRTAFGAATTGGAPASHAASHITGGDKLQLATDKLLGRATAGTGDIESITCTAAGRALLDDAAASNQCTTLGLGTSDSPTFTNLTLTGTASVAGLVSGLSTNNLKTFQLLGTLLRGCTTCAFAFGWTEMITDGGTQRDVSINRHTATFVAGIGWLSTHREALGWTWNLNNSASRYLTVPNHATLAIGNGTADVACTFFFWVKVANTSGTQIIACLGSGADAATDWRIILDSTEKVALILYDQSASSAYLGKKANSALSVGWHCVCITYSGIGGASANSGILIYVDGLSVTTASTSASGTYAYSENNSYVLGLMAGNAGGSPQGGLLAEIVMDRGAAWSAEQINAMYQATRGYHNI